MDNITRAFILAATSFAIPAYANIIVNGTSYSSGVSLNTANGKFTINGTAAGYINVKQSCTIVLDNVTWTDSTARTDAIHITDGLTVNLQLKGTNKITCSASDGRQTGIRVTSGTTLNITNLTEDASLAVIATAGYRDCAIGGSYNDDSNSSACGTVNIYGGTITARSGVYCAGIGGFGTGSSSKAKKGTGGTVRVYGGVLNAYGGGTTGGGAGIGGGYYGSGGAFYNYGGTVYATRGSSAAADIGIGASGTSTSATFYMAGGSTGLANGSVTGMANAVNPAGTRVYRVLIENCTAGKRHVFEGLPDYYKQSNIVPDANGIIHLWLPNGDYKFKDDTYLYKATVNGGKTTATREIKPRKGFIMMVY